MPVKQNHWRVSDEDKQAVKKLAKLNKMGEAEYVRWLIRREAKKNYGSRSSQGE